MTKFYYKAKKGLDSIVEGCIEAQSKEVALNNLFKEGLFPITIDSAASDQTFSGKTITEIKLKKRTGIKFRKKITSHHILVFTQKLAILIRAKVELLPALKIIYDQNENPLFEDVILQISNATEEGKSFSDSLSRFPNLFSSLYVNMIKSGEASGALDTALDQINEFLSRQEAMRTKIAVALAYPSLLLLVGVSSIFVLINFVVPRLKPIFGSLGEKLPLITKVILSISEVSNKSWWIILPVGAAFFFVIMRLSKSKSFLKNLGRKVKIKIPIVKRMIRNQELAQFSRSFSLLLKRGVPALSSLEIITPAIQDPVLEKGFKQVAQAVASGKSLSVSIENSTSLPNFFTKMVAVGEESGRLAEVLEEISRSYNQQVESDIALVSSLLEPLLILFLGLVLGTIVLSILIPTFQITQMVS